MNIFILDKDPRKAARMHCDKHVVKMILEGAQMLSTAHRILDGKEVIEKRYVNGSMPARYRNVKTWKLPDDRDELLYKATHSNHPCNIWCRETSENYQWLWQLTYALCDEYYLRYGKHKAVPTHHKIADSGILDALALSPNNIAKAKRTPFALAMPDVYKHEDPVMAYQNYYLFAKANLLSYTHRQEPKWVTVKREHDRILLEEYPHIAKRLQGPSVSQLA